MLNLLYFQQMLFSDQQKPDCTLFVDHQTDSDTASIPSRQLQALT